MLPIGFDSQLAMLGLGWLRAIDVPVNVAYRGRLLQYVLSHADVTTLVIAAEYLDRVVEVADELPDLHTVVIVDVDAKPIGARRVVGGTEFLEGVSPAKDLPGPRVPRYRSLVVHLGHDRTFEGSHRAVGTRLPILVLRTR